MNFFCFKDEGRDKNIFIFSCLVEIVSLAQGVLDIVIAITLRLEIIKYCVFERVECQFFLGEEWLAVGFVLCMES